MADLDVVVIGAVLAGICAVHALRTSGLSVRAFEAGGGIGGTWFWNSDPGARRDGESKDYGPYGEKCDQVAAAGYPGFALGAP